MSTWQIVVGSMVTLGLAWAFLRSYRRKQLAEAAAAQWLFSDLDSLLQEPQRRPGESSGSWKFTGRYEGQLFQIATVVDTLSTRKLPSLWLLVTLPKPQPLRSTIDIMLRPAGISSFSNFDFLPHTVPPPADYPTEAIIRSNDTVPALPLSAMAHALPILRSRFAKELLISPKGLRIVVQLAEADRVRYGVLREARFDGAKIERALATDIMETLLRIDRDIAENHA